MAAADRASVKIANASASDCKSQCVSGELDRYALREALYTPPEPGLPYIVIVLNAQDEVLSAKSMPSAKVGKNLVAKISAAFAAARASGKLNRDM
jgi:hypothetical protein